MHIEAREVLQGVLSTPSPPLRITKQLADQFGAIAALSELDVALVQTRGALRSCPRTGPVTIVIPRAEPRGSPWLTDRLYNEYKLELQQLISRSGRD